MFETNGFPITHDRFNQISDDKLRGGYSNQQDSDNKREEEYDFIRGFVMLLVTWGHVTNALFSGEIVYYFPAKLITATFAMPIYMLISGFFFSSSIKKHTLKEHLISRVRRLLIPCILWNIIIWAFVGVFKIILGKGSVSKLDISGIWFLWALLICDLVMSALVKILKKDFLIGIFSMLISIALILIPIEKWYLAWVFPFFAIGYFAKDIIGKVSGGKWNIWMVALALYILVLPFFKDDFLVYQSGSCIFNGSGVLLKFGIDLFRFLIGGLGVIAFTGVAFLIIKACKELHLVRAICYVGRNSLQVYVLQILLAEQLLTMVIRNIDPLKNILQVNYDITCNLVAPIVTIAVVLGCLGINVFIKRIRMINKILFGG